MILRMEKRVRLGPIKPIRLNLLLRLVNKGRSFHRMGRIMLRNLIDGCQIGYRLFRKRIVDTEFGWESRDGSQISVFRVMMRSTMACALIKARSLDSGAKIFCMYNCNTLSRQREREGSWDNVYVTKRNTNLEKNFFALSPSVTLPLNILELALADSDTHPYLSPSIEWMRDRHGLCHRSAQY